MVYFRLFKKIKINEFYVKVVYFQSGFTYFLICSYDRLHILQYVLYWIKSLY